ncbi:putative ABC transporter permease [Actinacidiphila reveromycinica]|uniref:Putative ABC transporter permease n=1 Tax=Actinacidiphila reveromycinica TaxID=659352 RepID=A0A7U3UXM5_9ACTN|nr:putative ABC transporter permease [Streptomyces sp. SN-593]
MIDAYEDPGTPDCRGAGRYLWWLLARQPGRTAAGAVLGSVWMVLMTLTPYVLSRAIDDGLEPGRTGALLAWSGALLVLGTLNAWVSIMRHRTMTRLRMDATFRTVKSVVGQATRLGASLPRLAGAGEVVTIGVTDVQQISQSLTMTGPGFGSVVAYLVVAVLLLSVSVPLGLVVLLGVPVIAVLVGPLLGRLRGAEAVYREQQGGLTARIGDLAGGLRVLNGLGGKRLFADAFRRDSRALTAQGYRVGAVTSWVQALGVGLPMLFLALVTWLAARMAARGTISVGEFVGVYGYVAVLVMPVAFFIECGYDVTRGLVAAKRVVGFLSLDPDRGDRRHATADAPATPSALRDPASGVEVAPGRLTALVGARPADSADVVDRLGGFRRGAVTWGAVRLEDVADAQVRERVLIADNEADLFAGSLRDMVTGRRPRDDASIASALGAAAARDVVAGLPDGLDTPMDAQARNLSGGQRQRVRLVRALLAEPEVLMAVEPTSALDAHTEAAVAAGLRAARAGRTTLVTGTSPVLLDQADTVHYLVDGKVAASGTHRELLRREAGYRALVDRSAAEDDLTSPPDALNVPDVPDTNVPGPREGAATRTQGPPVAGRGPGVPDQATVSAGATGRATPSPGAGAADAAGTGSTDGGARGAGAMEGGAGATDADTGGVDDGAPHAARTEADDSAAHDSGTERTGPGGPGTSPFTPPPADGGGAGAAVGPGDTGPRAADRRADGRAAREARDPRSGGAYGEEGR